MNSMERAPEPTMEEILASIRRIISDDEANSARQTGSSPARQPGPQASPDVTEDEADTQIIDDIARVLSGNASRRDEDEEILDLTKALDEDQPAEPTPANVSPSAGWETGTPMPSAPAEATQPEDAAAPEEALDLGAEQPLLPESASDEAASALEQAIAALRAGELPTLAPDFEEPAPEATSEPEAQAESEIASEVEASAAAESASEEESEAELLLTEMVIPAEAADSGDHAEDGEEPAIARFEQAEAEGGSAEAQSESTFWPRNWSSGTAPAEEPSPAMPEPELEHPRYGNGAGTYAPEAASPVPAGNKSMEESVKEMLRPLLRQWLDENMARVLEAALREELREVQTKRDRGNWPA